MALNAGDETVAAGTLAKAIYDNILAASDAGEFDEEADPAETAEAAQKRFAAAIAQAIVTHFTNNAEIEVTISTGTGGLQRVTGTDTDPPSTTKTLPGTLS
jgi:hypothetical protein